MRAGGAKRTAGAGAIAVLCVVAVAGCRSAESRKCHDVMATAQITVNEVDSSSMQSVEQSLKATETALAACQQAGNDTEAEQLEVARKRFSEHLERLKARAEKSEAEMDPARLARLVEQGDPACPKGQAYKHKKSGKEIRCSGPQLLEMTLQQATAYYDKRGYKLEQSPSSLRAEYGGELVVFEYGGAATKAPTCVTLYPPPGISWQEFTARLSGVTPDRLERKKAILRNGQTLPVAVEQSLNKEIVRIGDCGR